MFRYFVKYVYIMCLLYCSIFTVFTVTQNAKYNFIKKKNILATFFDGGSTIV